jgi:aspartyl-tRNA synthetase
MELKDITKYVHNSKFQLFKMAAINGERIRCLNAKGLANITTKEREVIEDEAKRVGSKASIR